MQMSFVLLNDDDDNEKKKRHVEVIFDDATLAFNMRTFLTMLI